MMIEKAKSGCCQNVYVCEKDPKDEAFRRLVEVVGRLVELSEKQVEQSKRKFAKRRYQSTVWNEGLYWEARAALELVKESRIGEALSQAEVQAAKVPCVIIQRADLIQGLQSCNKLDREVAGRFIWLVLDSDAPGLDESIALAVTGDPVASAWLRGLLIGVWDGEVLVSAELVGRAIRGCEGSESPPSDRDPCLAAS